MSNRATTVDNEILSSREAAGFRCEIDRDTGDFFRFPNPAQGVMFSPTLEDFRVFPQRAREVGANETRRNGINAHIVRAVFDCEIAHELGVCGLGDTVGAELVVAAKAAYRLDNNNHAVAACDHFWQHELGKPVIGHDVDAENFLKRRILQITHRSISRIYRGVADQDIDRAELATRLVHQPFKFFLSTDVARDRNRAAGRAFQFGVDRCRDLRTIVSLTAGDHDLRAMTRKFLCHGTTNAFAGTGDEGNFAREVE
jgi:hypothetical protein